MNRTALTGAAVFVAVGIAIHVIDPPLLVRFGVAALAVLGVAGIALLVGQRRSTEEPQP